VKGDGSSELNSCWGRLSLISRAAAPLSERLLESFPPRNSPWAVSITIPDTSGGAFRPPSAGLLALNDEAREATALDGELVHAVVDGRAPI